MKIHDAGHGCSKIVAGSTHHHDWIYVDDFTDEEDFERCHQLCWDNVYCNAFSLNRQDHRYYYDPNDLLPPDHPNYALYYADPHYETCTLYEDCDQVETGKGEMDGYINFKGETVELSDHFGVWAMDCNWGQ